MNKAFKLIDIEKVLFFDCEVVRNQSELDIDSKEFELFQKKTRDRATDEVLADEDVLAEYNRLAGLKMGYNKIVCISIGAVKKGKLYIKSITGEEKDVLDAFYEKLWEYDFVSGFNIVGYDLPMCQFNYLRHGLPNIPEAFNVSGKKPWDLKSIIELMDVVRGTHFANPSLDEVCFHLGVKSPKEGGIDGSQVSEVYYSEGVDRIAEYCNRDVMATVNVFRKLQGQEVFTEYVDLSNKEAKQEKVDVFTIINRAGDIPDEAKVELLEKASSLTKKEKENLIELIKASLASKDFTYEQNLFFDAILKTKKKKV
jgi:predicted PolB exonuclease-like 3'-5' exonuclease